MRDPFWKITLELISKWVTNNLTEEDIDDDVHEIINFVNSSKTQYCLIL